ncbi:dihydrolipoamide acetyltransferase family protein [Saccharopolyspora phatthalungensis]|uniref:Dihydrolipoamide acetyltransferase component of pyruvate dehydrogenase complex n=1 Tax=Saccharopolyspora phatthalungensis TaxID=664693 RepID=A0A840QBR9_9PSEU|nr:dihydrolipoamide acetyltransferase family protein [Saccharopolyspora phatthalungensis]MBB5155999.1 pyruvate dehydrogenase E2 component (dihydrolipoamide acetyltransferase) [Saccharopolyspora phatthalungensis]
MTWWPQHSGRWAEMAEFRMPSLGADMERGTLVEWLVHPGDTVHKGDLVAAVDTEKATIEVECFDTGIIDRLLVEPGQTVPVGTPLAVISAGAQGAPSGPAPAEPAAEKPPPPRKHKAALATPPVRKLAAQHGIDLAAVHGTGHGGAITHADVEAAIQQRTEPHLTAPAAARQRISPYARRLAAELGVDPSLVTGTGADGAVRARDVRAAAQEPTTTAPAPSVSRGSTAMRQAIAALMTKSKHEIPHYYLTSTIELSTALEWLRERNRRALVADRIVPAALLLKATALAARDVPDLNGHWINDHFEPADAVHLGVAVALHGGGLLTPSIVDAEQLPLTEIMRRLRELVSRARTAHLHSSDTTPATITVTNLGDLGVESVQGVIYPPQVALIGFGAVVHRPWAVGDLIGIRPIVTATLSGDHRATDGATGGRFLTTIDTFLQHPEEL